MSKISKLLTRRFFLGGVMMACLTSCHSTNNQEVQSEKSDKNGDSKTNTHVAAGNVRTDEQYVALALAREAITSGQFLEYYDLETSLKELFQVDRFDYYGIQIPKNSDYVRTRHVNRNVEYPSGELGYDATTLNYEYADCHYEGGVIDSRQTENYGEWPDEHLKQRIINLYNANGYEESYQQYNYNNDGEVDREVERLYERDEEGRVLGIREKDSDDGSYTIHIDITRECNENGQTLWHVKSKDGRDDGRCEYEYDSSGRLTKKSYVHDSYSEEFEFRYDESGRLIECINHEREKLNQDVAYKYYDEFHRIEIYDEITDSQHCSPKNIYQFDSKGTLVYMCGKVSSTLYSYDKDGNMIMQEEYMADELTSMGYFVYDEGTGLLRAQSTVMGIADHKDKASSYAFSYENVATGEVFDYSNIDEILDLQLNIANVLGPDVWDTFELGFGENRNMGSEILATDVGSYHKALEYANKLSEPKTLPPYSELLLHRAITKEEDTSTDGSEKWVGTWEAQAYAGGVVTVHVMPDNTYTINGVFPTYEWADSGEWHTSTYLDDGIEMPGTEQPIGYALYLKDSMTYLAIDGEVLPAERIASE